MKNRMRKTMNVNNLKNQYINSNSKFRVRHSDASPDFEPQRSKLPLQL